MGQRSQIYVRFNLPDGTKHLVPRYYQWNYGERMISRTRGIIEWLMMHTGHASILARDTEYSEKLRRVMDTNFDYRDIVLGIDIFEEYQQDCLERFKDGDETDFEQYVFAGQDNNDGQVFIDLVIDYDHMDKNGDPKYVFKYAFRTYEDDDWNPMDPEQYMDWDYDDWRTNEYMQDAVKLTERNIRWIKKHAKLMTSDEMFEFAHYDYVKDMDPRKEE